MSEFILIVGLGNPGPRYALNRHNIGFQIVEALAKAHQLEFSRAEHKALTAHGTLDGYRVVLAKPQTWMNDSGQSVAPLAHFYKTSPERVLVIYDDLDIPLGTIRYRAGGSSGGHRGVQSILQQMGTNAFPRLRLGIGRPPGQMDPAAYVLQNFSDDEMTLVWEVMRLSRDLVGGWLQGTAPFHQEGMTWRVGQAQAPTLPSAPSSADTPV